MATCTYIVNVTYSLDGKEYHTDKIKECSYEPSYDDCYGFFEDWWHEVITPKLIESGLLIRKLLEPNLNKINGQFKIEYIFAD